MNTAANGRSVEGQYADVVETAQKLIDAAIADGGTTLKRDGSEVNVADGYVVGGKVKPCFVAPFDSPNLDDEVAAWIQQTPFTLGDNYIGSWLDGGQVYVDIVDIVYDQTAAEALAAKRGELAYFDLSKFESVYLTGEEVSAA